MYVNGEGVKRDKDQATAVRMAKTLKWNAAPRLSRLENYTAGTTWTGDLFAFY